MTETILITGGAGFIGSHLADELLRHGHRVRALDSLTSQVHPSGLRPEYLDPDVELIVGDVRDPEMVRKALAGVDAVFHLAAAVGVGQSMYRIEDYVSVNNVGTAVLLEALVDRPVRRLVVASSMSVYGEGLYRDQDGQRVEDLRRPLAQLRQGDFAARDALGRELVPVPTPETKLPSLSSIYALGKYDQERMCLITGQAYAMDTVALRFFNVFGTRQALSNPYTGVLAIFASRLLNDNRPHVFEDGLQRRDFVDVRDVARACRLALLSELAPFRALNIGSGQDRTILDIARLVASSLGKDHIEPQVTGRSRIGDIRNCFADVSLAREVLGFSPNISLEQGIADLAGWLEGQVAHDFVERASAELTARGLAV